VCSPPAFVSPRERRSATWALLRPAGGVNAAGGGGVEAAASAMPWSLRIRKVINRFKQI
jgi:hypothetical protein